jgi:hypothetical protein
MQCVQDGLLGAVSIPRYVLAEVAFFHDEDGDWESREYYSFRSHYD